MPFSSSDVQHVSANVEQIVGGGLIKFSCAEWNVIIDVTFDPFDRVSTESVHKVSACIQHE